MGTKLKQEAKQRRAARASTQLTVADEFKVVRRRLSSIKPSPDNARLYDDFDPFDPKEERFIESLRTGLREAIVITRDGIIVGGHRRFAGLMFIGAATCPCRILNIRRSDLNGDQWLALLREHNLQRDKSAAEKMRETLLDMDPVGAVQELREMRDKSIECYTQSDVEKLEIEGEKRRHNISSVLAEHVKYIKLVLEERRQYWPLSVRAIHYPLLNHVFFRNTRERKRYVNDEGSYKATSRLCTRLRLLGEIPWRAITDGTRPVHLFRPFADVRHFIRQECKKILSGYWRNLLQTQPNHVEVLCEKNTVYHMVLSVTKRFQIPTMSGRGFCSIDPYHELYERYRDSGKEKLILIVLSDFDPEGQMIPQVAARTLRDDFGVWEDDLVVIKAGVTRRQIDEYELPVQNFAKDTSSNHRWFVDQNGGDESVYELEALDPAAMIADLEATITSVLDMELFNAEAKAESEEQLELAAAQKIAAEALKGLYQ